jgi:hypothetical protein
MSVRQRAPVQKVLPQRGLLLTALVAIITNDRAEHINNASATTADAL